MPNCAVKNCKNSSNVTGKSKANVSFHRFPHEPYLKEKWIEATGNKDWFPNKYSTICSIHFEEASFEEGRKRRTLSKSAYPTIDVLKITTTENIDVKVMPEQASVPPKKRKLEQDDNELPTSSKNTPKEIKLLEELKQTKDKVKQQSKFIKILRERHRRKVKKIQGLMAVMECLKKDRLLTISKLICSAQPTLQLNNSTPNQRFTNFFDDDRTDLENKILDNSRMPEDQN